MTGPVVVDLNGLVQYAQNNSYELSESTPPPSGEVPVKTVEIFAPKWRQYSGQAGTEINIIQGVDLIELYTEPVYDARNVINTLVTLKLKAIALEFTVHKDSRYSIELPAEYEKYWPMDGLDEGSAQFWIPGGRNMWSGSCFWTNRDNTPWHLLFAFSDYGEFEKNWPINLASVGAWKLRASIQYGIML